MIPNGLTGCFLKGYTWLTLYFRLINNRQEALHSPSLSYTNRGSLGQEHASAFVVIVCFSSGLYAHNIIDVAVGTTAQLSTQTLDTVIPLKVSNDPLTTGFRALLLTSIFPEVSASPEEANRHQRVWEWWEVRRALHVVRQKSGKPDHISRWRKKIVTGNLDFKLDTG